MGSAAKKKEAQATPTLRVMSPEMREEYVVRYRGKARKLARSILRKWRSRLDITEVDSLVDLSLCESVQRFSPDRGASFMTFLFYHLRGNLIRAITHAVQSSAIPMVEVDSLIALDEGGEGSNQRGAINAIEIANALTSQEELSPDEALYRKEMIALSQRSYQHLDNLEQQVLSKLYAEENQMIDIARNLGYSRCHISRVKRRALEALYTDIANRMRVDDIALTKPDFEEEDLVTVPRRSMDRRKIVRRRPRSQSIGTKERKAAING